MKKLMPVVIALLISSCIAAQYKKATFFSKSGRTYELGSQMYMFGDGKGSPIGFKIGFGRDQDGKRFFSSWEIQYIPSYNYSYSTVDYNNDPVNVKGTTKATWVYAINYNLHLLKNEEGQRKLMPFVNLGLNFALSSGPKTETHDPEYAYDTEKATADGYVSTGIGGGLGTLINLTPTLGFKLQGGYNYQFNFGGDDYGVKPYYLYTSHPYVTLTFRVRLVTE